MQDLFSGFCEVVVKVGDDHPGKKEKRKLMIIQKRI
jgi:hypothetical protein